MWLASLVGEFPNDLAYFCQLAGELFRSDIVGRVLVIFSASVELGVMATAKLLPRTTSGQGMLQWRLRGSVVSQDASQTLLELPIIDVANLCVWAVSGRTARISTERHQDPD